MHFFRFLALRTWLKYKVWVVFSLCESHAQKCNLNEADSSPYISSAWTLIVSMSESSEFQAMKKDESFFCSNVAKSHATSFSFNEQMFSLQNCYFNLD